jgi:hypothetical protein
VSCTTPPLSPFAESVMLAKSADLSFLSRFPHQAKNEIEALFAAKHLMAVGSWQSAWKMIASFCIELQDVTIRHEVPELFSLLIKQIGPGAGELEQMMQALQYSNNPKFASVIGDKISPAQICGAVHSYLASQCSMDVDRVMAYAVVTTVEDLSFGSLGTSDVLTVSPTTAGAMGEDTVKSILDRLKIEYTEQYRDAYMCDFGEMKRPDFKVGAVKAQGDARLSNGFYIESTTRLNEKHKDIGLFYLLHQVAQHSDLPTIVVYDGPALSDRVWDWAQGFCKKHMKDNKLFAVVTYQQFREWALRKLGSQAK